MAREREARCTTNQEAALHARRTLDEDQGHEAPNAEERPEDDLKPDIPPKRHVNRLGPRACTSKPDFHTAPSVLSAICATLGRCECVC